MLALRTSTSLSALALVLGIACTSWLTALTYERAPMTRRLAEVTLPTAAPALVSKTVSQIAPSRSPAPNASSVMASASPRARAVAAPTRASTTRAPQPPVASLVPVYMPSPRYPMSALRARREGQVVLSVTVTPEGDVAGVSVGRSSGDDALDRAAEEAVRGWRFAAANDRPAHFTADLPVNFELTRD